MSAADTLWQRLQALEPRGYVFHRDLKLGGQVVSFGCRRPKLAIDLFAKDSDQRARQLKSQELMKLGYVVIAVEDLSADVAVGGLMEVVEKELARASGQG